METECIQFELDLQGGRSRKVVVRNDGDINSSDGGMLHRLAQPRTGNLLAGGFAEAGGLRFGPGVRGPHRPRSVASRSDFGCGLRGGPYHEPDQIVLDFDSSDIPLRGEQEGASGTLEALQWIIPLIRAKWPHTKIIIRADSGFCRDAILSWIESQQGVFYVVGLARNSRLEEEIDTQLVVMSVLCRLAGRPQRIFEELLWQTRESWSCERRVVAKAEALVGKPNPRFVVTNLPQKQWPARILYQDLYCARGDM